MKKWLPAKHATLFRLNNKNVQVIFKDKSEIILSSTKKTLTYLNKKRKSVEYTLENALQSTNSDLAKRIEYTRSLVKTLLYKKPNPDIFSSHYSNPRNSKGITARRASSHLFGFSPSQPTASGLIQKKEKAEILNSSIQPFRLSNKRQSAPIISNSNRAPL